MFCSGTFAKTAVGRHLASCKARWASIESSGKGSRRTRLLHLAVQGRYNPQYWMHLEADAKATLRDMDDFLRFTWLECCGHLSAFRIDVETYYSTVFEAGDKGMLVQLGKVLQPGLKCYYEYDFGTTTELALRVVSERDGEAAVEPIQLLARNDAPSIACSSCGETATQVCAVCVYSGTEWLCEDCAMQHECGEDMLLPVVNSPRVGACAYAGP